jgi:ribosomal protein S12 methylthiotransferase accessory factor
MLTEEIKRKTPEQTLRDVNQYFDEVGITRVADITGMDRIGIPVYAAIRPDSMSLAVDSGKGITKEQAKCSAVMEAIERWAHDEQGGSGIHGIALSNRAYRFPLAKGANFNVIYNHRWYEAEYWKKEFVSDKVFVPYYCVKNYERRLPLYEMCWQSGTNGLAAGNTRNEAILQGLYEIIERDAVSIWMAKGAGRRLDNETVIDDTLRTLIGLCEEGAGVKVCICDATSDIGVPVYVCIMVDMKADIGPYKGYGCNLDSNIALQRAICEAAQSRAVFLSGARDDRRWIRHVFESQPVTTNKMRLCELAMEEVSPYERKSANFLTDEDKISYMDDVLVAVGCGHVIVADIMHREHACVVKVLSESLEGYWNPYLKLGRRAE